MLSVPIWSWQSFFLEVAHSLLREEASSYRANLLALAPWEGRYFGVQKHDEA